MRFFITNLQSSKPKHFYVVAKNADEALGKVVSKLKHSQFSITEAIPQTIHKKVVLLQYDNCGPFVQLVTSSTPLTLERIAAYFERVDGANWERDSLTILSSDGKLAELSIDKKSRK